MARMARIPPTIADPYFNSHEGKEGEGNSFKATGAPKENLCLRAASLARSDVVKFCRAPRCAMVVRSFLVYVNRVYGRQNFFMFTNNSRLLHFVVSHWLASFLSTYFHIIIP